MQLWIDEEPSDGIKQFAYLLALFYSVLWAICSLLSLMPCYNGCASHNEEINCLLMAQCAE